MMQSPAACRPDGKSSRAGGSGFWSTVSPGWRITHARGGPELFPPEVVVTVKALACELPARAQRPLARWSMSELAAATQRTGLVASISGSTIWRWLHDVRDSAVVSSQLDLSARSELCAQGRSDSGPLRARLGGATPGRGRLRDLRR